MSEKRAGNTHFGFNRHEAERLWWAAACVANAIAAGAGACIKDTLMEKELRDALKLKPGEFVDIHR